MLVTDFRRGLFRGSWLLVCASCSVLGNVDDLEGNPLDASAGSGGFGGSGGSTDAAQSCSAEKGCLGCATCEDYCDCTVPFAAQSCKADCNDAGLDAASDAGLDATAVDAAADGNDDGPIDICDSTTYHNKKCADLPSITPCENCMIAKCCLEMNSCLAKAACAGFAYCNQTKCGSVLDSACGLQECGQCFSGASNELFAVSNCAQDNCNLECSQ